MRKRFALPIALALAAALSVSAEGIADLKAGAEAAGKAAEAAPQDYAANWQAAKAYYRYGDEMVGQETSGWKNLAKDAAKAGMKYGELAAKINPKSVEGWYWYGLCVGTYSDCVSILAALNEGLKGKTQKAFETSYALDKSYNTSGPVIALGRYWQVLPGIAGRDVKKAEQLFKEYLAAVGSDPKIDKNIYYYMGALDKEKGNKAEAKVELQKAADLGSKPAAKLLAELK
jgi:hypothetical protein